MNCHCQCEKLSKKNTEFTVGSHWNARKVTNEDTTFSLGLKDGDEIFVRHIMPQLM